MATTARELDGRQMIDGRHMNGAEALMWALDGDPALRSSFMGVTFVDGTPDPDRLRQRMRSAISSTPILLERVVTSPFDIMPPRWQVDSRFDLDYHVRHVALPPPGDERQLLDLAAILYADPFDKTRPLWQFTVVSGLSDGRAAFLSKMHHVIADGIGAIRMSNAFLDIAADGNPPTPTRPRREPRDQPETAARRGLSLPSLGDVVRLPLAGIATGRSLARQLAVTDPARSPLWVDRSYAHRFDTVSFELEAVRSVAKDMGGTVNDAYVTILADAVGRYHDELDRPVDQLRMAMPISLRHDKAVGGNAWVPSRVLVPTAAMSPKERFAEVHARLSGLRREQSLGLTDTIAGVARRLPPPLLLRFARQQTGTVDFACSNVRGAPFDLWISGAAVLANHPMGPTAGAAFNATVMSYRGSLDLGLSTDTGAIDEPGLLLDCIRHAAADLLS